MTTQERRFGKIKWFDNKRGFGFLTDIDSNEDIFVHFSSIQVNDNIYKTLIEGEYVEFSRSTDKNDKSIAVEVTGLRRGPLLCQNTTRRIYSVKNKNEHREHRESEKNVSSSSD